MKLLSSIILSLSLLSTSSFAFDKSYQAARKYFSHKKYKHAEVLFMKSYKQETDSTAKVQILKFIAASRYYQGKKKLALSAFKLARKYNPNVRMVTRDQKLAGFFNKSLPTTFIINSNTKDAIILVDGIMAGNPGQKIDSKSGIVKVTITSPGYRGRVAKLKIRPNRTNKFTVNLKEIVDERANERMVSRKPRRPSVSPLQNESYQRRKPRIVVPTKNFIDKAEGNKSMEMASEEMRNEMNSPQAPRGNYHPQTDPYANSLNQPVYNNTQYSAQPVYQQPQPVYQQPQPVVAAPPPPSNYAYPYGAGIQPPVVRPVPVANPTPVPQYYRMPTAPSPQYQQAPSSQPPVLLHH